jgi:hypothetical protein
MAGPISIKLNKTITINELAELVEKNWNEEKYGKASLVEFRDRPYIHLDGSDWFNVLAYPGRKKVTVQSLPENGQVILTSEGKKQMKMVNKEVLPKVAEGFREILSDILK